MNRGGKAADALRLRLLAQRCRPTVRNEVVNVRSGAGHVATHDLLNCCRRACDRLNNEHSARISEYQINGALQPHRLTNSAGYYNPAVHVHRSFSYNHAAMVTQTTCNVDLLLLSMRAVIDSDHIR